MFDRKAYFIAPKDKSKWYNKRNLWQMCYDTWNKSSFDTVLLNDEEDIDNIIAEHDHYDFLEVLQQIPKINKIDYVRYVLLAHEGGLYADMDMYLNTDFKHLLTKDQIYIAGRKGGISNCLIISPPHLLWQEVMRECRVRIMNHFEDLKTLDNETLNQDELFFRRNHQCFLTGSTLVHDTITRLNQWKRVTVLDGNYFNREARNNPFAYTIHYQTGLWRLTPELRRQKEEGEEQIIVRKAS